jgi:hypothetical protein
MGAEQGEQSPLALTPKRERLKKEKGARGRARKGII